MVDPSGYRAAAQAIVAALVLMPVSLVPCLSRPAAELYFAWAVVLGVGQLACAVGFFVQLSDASARRLLLASLVYLPAMMGLLRAGTVGLDPNRDVFLRVTERREREHGARRDSRRYARLTTHSRHGARRMCSSQYHPGLPHSQRQADRLVVPVDRDHVLRRA